MTTQTHSQRQSQAIVVGGGLAGLAAATYLARDGARVTLLEHSAALGGRAATDTPAGFALNRGAHALYTGGPASSVLRELDVRYSSGQPSRVFARDADGLKPFPASVLDLVRTNLLSAGEKRELLGVFMRLGVARPEKYARMSVADWISATAQRPKVRQLLEATARTNLYTTALDLASADALVARLQQTLKHPIHYIDGGWQSLVDGLRDAAATAGVDILTSAGVETVQVQHGQATGVRMHDGRALSADTLVIATPPEDALHLFPEGAMPRLEASVAGLVAVHIACLDVALSKLPAPEHPVVFDLDQPCFLTAQSEFARLAPPSGGAVLHAFLQLDPRAQADPHQVRAQLEAFVDAVQPGWQTLAVERRFLPHMLASGALPLASRGGLGGRLQHHSQDVDNVYFAGDWVGPHGYLVDATLASAREAARQAAHARTERPTLVAA
jgi:phytoene dehydrogenase-like protein